MTSADLALAAKEPATPSPARSRSVAVCVIRHSVMPGHEAAYEAWLREIVGVAGNAEGDRGVNITRPRTGSRTYTIVLHFDTLEHLELWLASEAWSRLMLEVQPLLQVGDAVEIKTGLEFWFTPAGSEQKHAKPYKQFLVTLSVIFPLTMLVPWLLTPVFRAAPVFAMPGIIHLLVASIVVALMTYVIMPRYTRLMAAWLYR
jgi:antibiotic biosynthesis monooxygenase (ABM) superfamily enzyme